MSSVSSVVASLSATVRQDIGIQVVARSQPISHLAATHQVSRKFVYQQGDRAQQALDESFAPSKAKQANREAQESIGNMQTQSRLKQD